MRYKVASRTSYEDERTFVREHVLVAEQKLGRKLNPEETVHHKDGNKENNNPSNLMVFATNSDHIAFHHGADAYEKDGVWHSVKKPRYQTCERCGRQFIQKGQKRYTHVYCSHECASQARTKVDIDKDSLVALLVEYKANFVQIGKRLGISDNAVRRKCVKYGLPSKSSDYR